MSAAGTNFAPCLCAHSSFLLFDIIKQTAPSMETILDAVQIFEANLCCINILLDTETRLDKNSSHLVLVEGIKTFVQERPQNSFVYFYNLDGNLK
jgi:hypothetical protein